MPYATVICHPAIKGDPSASLSDGKRFVARADEKLSAVVEPEAAIREIFQFHASMHCQATQCRRRKYD